jgi:hypothetical protein
MEGGMKKVRFIDNGDGTITDLETGLMWVKDGRSKGCNYGQGLTWEKSVEFCEKLDYGGYKDWKLPNLKELQSIIVGRKHPRIETTFFTNTNLLDYVGCYWTSTTWDEFPEDAHIVHFLRGETGYGIKEREFYIRPVRIGDQEKYNKWNTK